MLKLANVYKCNDITLFLCSNFYTQQEPTFFMFWLAVFILFFLFIRCCSFLEKIIPGNFGFTPNFFLFPKKLKTMSESLASTLTTIALQSTEPWRAELARRRLQIERLQGSTTSKEDQVRLFAALAKENLLSCDEVIALTYLILGNASDRQFFISNLLLADNRELTIRHNFYVGIQSGDDFLERHGEKLGSLRFPLFPNDPAFASLNVKLLTLHKAGSEGAGPSPAESMFRKKTEGGFALPVFGSDGLQQAMVDTAQLDNTLAAEFNELKHAMGRLEQALHIRPRPNRFLNDSSKHGSLPPQRERGRGRGASRGSFGGRGDPSGSHNREYSKNE